MTVLSSFILEKSKFLLTDKFCGKQKDDRNGLIATYTYTQSGKVDTISYSDSSTSIKFTYDDLDNLKTMTDSLGGTGTVYGYDAANRIQTITNPYGFAVSYSYDEAGNIKTLTYPGGKTVTYTYDVLNRLKTVNIDWLTGQVATYNYKDQPSDPDDNLVHYNGLISTYSYDNANRLSNIAISTNPVISSTSLVFSFALTVDANGNRKDITERGTLSPALSTSATDYAYKPATSGNRLLNDGTTAFGYDNEGQMTGAYGQSRTFDIEHRLKTIGNSTEFFYDGAGNRLKAKRGDLYTCYVYDASGNLLAETAPDKTADCAGKSISRYYIYGKGLLAMVTSDGKVYNYHFNPVGSTVAITDQTQAVVNQYAYEPYGEVLANQVEAILQPFKFVGQFGVMAEDNGLYYMKARYYDAKIGRFISEDPSGFEGGVNLYSYVGNNPLNWIDPSGLEQTCICQAKFSAVGPNQAAGIGALGIAPPNDSVAISPEAFGLPYGTLQERIATQKEIRENMGNIRIEAPGLSDYLTGGTTFTIGDVGDRNIRNSTTVRFDIYRFATQKDALNFGARTVPVTITGVPKNWKCPQ